MTIPELHRLYCSLTGRDLTLDYMKESSWSIWMRYRKHEPFTEEDLKLVVRFLKWKIQKGEAKVSYLHFNNIVGSPDLFEENLQDARAWAKRPGKASPKAVVMRSTGRQPEPPPKPAKPIGELIPKLVAQMRAAIERKPL